MNDNVQFAPPGRPLAEKSTLEEIRARFDQDVERFSNLETGQRAFPDALVVLELVAQCAATHLRPGNRLVDLGCGAGNFTLRVLREVRPLECHLVDLSGPMLDRARGRLEAAGVTSIHTHQTDLRAFDCPENSVDCILAGAVLHHLRDDADWLDVFSHLHRWLKPGGTLYVADAVIFDTPAICGLMWKRFGRHLESLGGAEYREKVLAYIDKEDSPRSMIFQLDLLKQVGFSHRDVLHRNGISGCYYAVKQKGGPAGRNNHRDDPATSLIKELSQNDV
jgi:tRNA (cmo5U34)-methyltransferase